MPPRCACSDPAAPAAPSPCAAQLHIDYPMLFQVENRRDARSTHCGVLEFIADEGMVYMPYWVRCFPCSPPLLLPGRVHGSFHGSMGHALLGAANAIAPPLLLRCLTFHN